MRRERAYSGPIFDDIDDINTPLIDVVLFVVGVALLLIMGYTGIPVMRALFEALGTSFVVAAIVSYLLRKFYLRVQEPEIEIVAHQRTFMPAELKALKNTAGKVNLLGVALIGALEEIGSDKEFKVLRRVLFSGLELKLLFVSPSAIFLKQRAREDGLSESQLKELVQNSLRNCAKIYSTMRRLYNDAQNRDPAGLNSSGRLEIRLIDACPYVSMYHCDDMLFVGNYTSALRGLDGVLMKISNPRSTLFQQYNSHFEVLWSKSICSSNGSQYLVEYYHARKPEINTELMEVHLSKDWQDNLQRNATSL